MFKPDSPFELTKLPPTPNLDLSSCPDKIIEAYLEAQKNISEFNGAIGEMVNPEILLELFYLNETVTSLGVEYIFTDVASVLEDNLKMETERKAVNKEAIKYKEAIKEGGKLMKKFGLTQRTVTGIHKCLDVGVGNPGEFRKVQNHVAKTVGAGKNEIVYTPPIASSINNLMSNLENYINTDTNKFPLIRVIVSHYQFEAIHPFLDGNGRTGRILMVLQLKLYNQLKYPVLYISSYLNKHSGKYKSLLLNISKNQKWWDFIEFMLKGFSIQALNAKKGLNNLKKSKKDMKSYLFNEDSLGIIKSNVEIVVNHLFSYPKTHAQNMANNTNIHRETCSKYLNALEKAKFLESNKSGTYKFYSNIRALKSLLS